MAVQIKTIKKRISSVKSISQITKAMEMVASYKMKRATRQALNTRAYATTALELLLNISREQKENHPLLESRKVNKILLIVIASNKGLCGSYNSNVFKKVDEFVEANKEATIDFITIGKKAERRVKRGYGNYLASFIDIPELPGIKQIFPCAKLAIDGFIKKEYDQVAVIYTDFISVVKHEVVARTILPISAKSVTALIDKLGENKDKKEIKSQNLAICIFEPSPRSVLNEILPHLVEVQLYQALLEANASEHSARMITMKNASESAFDMISDLTIAFNQARQASITQEILEIASGSVATE